MQSPEELKNDNKEAKLFNFSADGEQYCLATNEILFLESLENYVKVYTADKTYITRLSLKDAERRLPTSLFLRISRSHIINMSQIDDRQSNAFVIAEYTMKIGKTYKKYVEERVKGAE